MILIKLILVNIPVWDDFYLIKLKKYYTVNSERIFGIQDNLY